jgi:hypothetical protein
MRFGKLIWLIIIGFFFQGVLGVEIHDISTSIKGHGMIDDYSSSEYENGDDYPFQYDYSWQIKDKTITNGGKIDFIKIFDGSVKKSLTYDPINTGQLSASTSSSSFIDDPWVTIIESVEGETLFNGSGIIQSEIGDGGPYFRYTVGPNTNTTATGGQGSAKISTYMKTEFHDVQYRWNDDWRMTITREELQYHKELKDTTSVTGDIHMLSKAYNYEYGMNPEWFEYRV